ncbi:DUF2628 domain-containing protein [Bradyrhizobium sp. IC3069]|uniref:DUF2628 domain-containing protein n=1 Tax=unclassified Bradyrhizobium TaxID=2631580 RepID=UPI001CD7EEB3|nr:MULTISPECIES: DUF2628 domain-containing protein [unclassified Bradyrhizobium]MCA1364040.1 DUF2628 domain-containing protein [Bradyrhizobium sp. IC4059]MCA1522077.1 DUF2628 domain-containing protein [Bradyrhizobium sp. IC3069]
MPVYTVHAPSPAGADPRASDKFVFVRDGFHFWAMIFGPFWLLWNRLWLALIGYLIFLVAFNAGLSSLGVGRSSIFFADCIVALLMGLEASSLRRWTLSRGKWRQLDIVVADDSDTAERRFFERWSQKQNGSAGDQRAVDRGGPPPTRNVPGQPFSNPPPIPAGGIIGLFPEPGGSR